MSLTIINPFVFAAGGGGASVGGPAIYHDGFWENAPLTQNLGWRFTVGANDVVVAALRLYNGAGTDLTETVTIYRESDGAVIAQANVTANAGWGDTEITPVSLAASTDYVVSRYQAGATRAVHRNPGAAALDPALTFVEGRVGASAGIPTSTAVAEYFSASFRTQAPADGYRFYRLYCIANNGGGTVVGSNELGLRESIGGASAAVGSGGKATSTRSLISGTVEDAAFDGTTGTAGWYDTTGVAVNGKWLMFDFGSGDERAIAEYSVGAYPTGTSTAARSLNAWELQASNDLETWDTLDTVSGETGWSLGETRVFTL